MATKTVVLNSLADLAQVRDRFAVDDRVPESMALVPVIGKSDPEAIEALNATTRAALDELQVLLAADRTRRDEAEAVLARWRRVAGEAASTLRIAGEMRDAVRQADDLARNGFDEADRKRAALVAAHTARLATQAQAHAAVQQREADALAEREDVRRLLAEERNQEQEEGMRATLAIAAKHLDGGGYEEARRLLTSVEKSISSVPDLVGTFRTLQNRAEAVKVRVAESALREARRLHRREPVAALGMLEPLDLEALPEDLVRHLYGLWLTACRRIGLLAAVHYRAAHGRGAVLIPADDGQWEVVSAIGLREWDRGRRFAPQALRGVRPLTRA